MEKREYVTLPELAKILRISRIAVYKKVKKGQLPAQKVGKIYVIPKKYIDAILGKALSDSEKKEIDTAVKKTVSDYGEVLKLLGKE
jgi:excisionase family DNA binding protein